MIDEDNGQLGRTVRSGLAISGTVDVLRQVVDFTTAIILARLLTPNDFGLVAVVVSFLQLSYVVGNFGMGGAVVQARSLSRTDEQTAFTVSVLVAIVLAGLAAAAAPLCARFFSMPALVQIMPIMSLQIVFSGMTAVPVALLRRDLLFARVSAVDGGAALVYAATGITMAVTGFGVWSLVWAPLAAAVWSVLAGMVLAKFVPRLTIARLSVAKFARFGANLTLKNVFVYLSRNIDNLIVARMLGAAATGIYSRGYNLTRMPQVRLVMIIYQVCFPAFCRVRYEPDKFRDVYRKASIIVAVVTSPLLLGLCALAPDFVLALLGPQWVAMSPVLRVLSIAALISCLHALSGAAIEATGKVGYEVMSQMVYAALIVVGTLVGSRYGLVAVAWAIVGASVSLYALKVYTMRLATGLSYRDFIGTAIPSVLAATFMLVALTAMLHVLGDPSGLLPTDAHWQRLLVGTAVGAILYGATLWLLCAAHVQLLLRQLQLLWSARRLPWRREADANSSA